MLSLGSAVLDTALANWRLPNGLRVLDRASRGKRLSGSLKRVQHSRGFLHCFVCCDARRDLTKPLLRRSMQSSVVFGEPRWPKARAGFPADYFVGVYIVPNQQNPQRRWHHVQS